MEARTVSSPDNFSNLEGRVSLTTRHSTNTALQLSPNGLRKQRNFGRRPLSEYGEKRTSDDVGAVFSIILAFRWFRKFFEILCRTAFSTYRILCLVYTYPMARNSAWSAYRTLMISNYNELWRTFEDYRAEAEKTKRSLKRSSSLVSVVEEPELEFFDEVDRNFARGANCNFDASIYTVTPRSSSSSMDSMTTSENWDESQVLNFLGARRVAPKSSSSMPMATAVTSVVTLDLLSASTQPLSLIERTASDQSIRTFSQVISSSSSADLRDANKSIDNNSNVNGIQKCGTTPFD